MSWAYLVISTFTSKARQIATRPMSFGRAKAHYELAGLKRMKTSIQLIEQIIRAKTALHLKLIAHRNGGKVDIGGGRIDDLLAEVDAGLSRYERMLVRYKNELAAAVMESAEADADFEKKNPRDERG